MFFYYEKQGKKRLPQGTKLYFIIESIADRAFSVDFLEINTGIFHRN